MTSDTALMSSGTREGPILECPFSMRVYVPLCRNTRQSGKSTRQTAQADHRQIPQVLAGLITSRQRRFLRQFAIGNPGSRFKDPLEGDQEAAGGGS